jgi:MFS family permease
LNENFVRKYLQVPIKRGEIRIEGKQVIHGLYAAAFIQMVGVGLIVALLPSKVIALSGTMANVGLIASAFAVPFVLLQLPVGNLGDRFGHKRFLVAGYVIAGLTGSFISRPVALTPFS